MSKSSRRGRSLELLLDSLDDHAIFTLDVEGRVTSWSAGAENLYGHSAEAVLGQPQAWFFSLEDRHARRPEEIREQAQRDGHVDVEGWRLRKGGSRFWATGSVHAMHDEAGELAGYAVVTRDTTAQREAQHALLESERRFRLLVEGVVDSAIYMLDVNGVITAWNRGAERIKGYRSEEIVGQHFGVFYTAGERQAGLPARDLQAALREGHQESEGWRLRKDGSRFWASTAIDPIHDEDGRLIGFAKITRDVSQRRAAEEALADSERQFRLLISSIVDYALYTLDPNGIVTSWNPGAEHIKGYTADEIVGQHFSRFYTDVDRAAGLPAQALQTATAQGRYEAERWRVRKDGSLFWASVIIDPIRDADGRLVGFAKITRDITERHNAQQELQRAHDQLAQAQKMEALGKLTGGVAHDFNNLLMVVSGHAQLLRRRLASDERGLRSLDALEAAAKRGEDLTRHLLAFSRRQRLQPTSVALPDQVEALKELLTTSLPPSIQLSLAFPPDLWPVQVDPNELELGLLNLAVNGRDAMAKGGALSVEASNVTLAGAEADGGLSGDFVAIQVSDTGEGIPPDILPRIFDPFFTTKDVSKGTGLGLSQVYGFAEQSGGRVTVASELGRGSTFTLYLPRSGAQPQAAPESAPAEDGAGACILLVEDNPEVAEVAAGMLEQLGHRVEVASNAAAALEVLRGPLSPDLVFSDIVMAGELDGVGLARRLREENPSLPVLLATGYSQAAEPLGGEFPILRKPYRMQDLSRAIGALLARPPDPDGNFIRLPPGRRARSRGQP
jgi:PAS domain S-box-containing protein